MFIYSPYLLFLYFFYPDSKQQTTQKIMYVTLNAYISYESNTVREDYIYTHITIRTFHFYIRPLFYIF